jgi:hypothetical protein
VDIFISSFINEEMFILKKLKFITHTIILIAISTIFISCTTNIDSNNGSLSQITDMPDSTNHTFPMSVDDFYKAYDTNNLGYHVPWTPSIILDYRDLDNQEANNTTTFGGYIYSFDKNIITAEKIDWITPEDDSTISGNYDIRLTDDIQEYTMSESVEVWILSDDIGYHYRIPTSELNDYLKFYEEFEISNGFPSCVEGKEIHTALWSVYLLDGEVSVLIESYLP